MAKVWEWAEDNIETILAISIGSLIVFVVYALTKSSMTDAGPSPERLQYLQQCHDAPGCMLGPTEYNELMEHQSTCNG